MDTRKSGFGMKLVKVIVIALVFGLVAGGTFAGVNFAYSKFFPSTTTETSGYKGTAVEGTAVSTATTVKDVSDIVSNVMPSVVLPTFPLHNIVRFTEPAFRRRPAQEPA